MKKGFTKNKPILSSCFLILTAHQDPTYRHHLFGGSRLLLLCSREGKGTTTSIYNSRVPYHTLSYPIIAQLEHYRTDGRCQSRVKKDSFEKRIVLSPARSHKQKAPEILPVRPSVKFGLRQHDGFQAPRGGNEEKN
eukprot:scaffold306_cov149-Amphora_coffeaeformis.AAC.3